MTSKERIKKALKFKKVDYIPVFTNKRAMGPALIGRKVDRELYRDAEALAKSALAIWEEVQDDAYLLGGTSSVQLGLGCKLKWPGNDHPCFGEATVTTREDAEKLEVPDPHKNEFMSAMIEAVSIVKKQGNPDVPIRISWHGVFNNLSRLLGVERMMNWLITDMDSVHILCKKIVETQIAYGKALKEAGLDILEIGDAMSGPGVVSPKITFEVGNKYHHDEVAALKEAGLITMFHQCGGEYPIIDHIRDVDADVFWFSELVDISVAQKIFYKRYAVSGGMDPTNILYLETPEGVDAEVKRIFSGLKHRSGVILQPGCGLSSNIPVKNLKAMTEAARRYSELAGVKKVKDD